MKYKKYSVQWVTTSRFGSLVLPTNLGVNFGVTKKPRNFFKIPYHNLITI